jgi:hypothetical protein
MIYYGLEWKSLDSYFQMKEITAPGTPQANELRLYAKDKAGTSALYYKNDAGVEIDLSSGITGSGATNRLAYWSGALVLAANAALTQNRLLTADANGLPLSNAALTSTRVLFADANGLPTDSANFCFVTGTPKFFIGSSSFTHTGSDGRVSIESDGANVILELNNHNDAGNAYIFAHRSRGTHASPTIVSDGDTVFGLLGKAYGGSSYHDLARIFFAVDGTPGNNDMPGRIVFYTTADGATSLTERLRLNCKGHMVQPETATDPATGDLSADAAIAIYNKNDKFVIAYNNGGTLTYISIPLDGSTTTWTHNTSAP